ncbi:Vimentin [Pteropus alecto]|uniref:Vimentin n=1 Tax=Pteropus alecto TaxID=9402 RepID=L5JQU0_PTEAL|nr:Vimentin [Pteropus alecto]
MEETGYLATPPGINNLRAVAVAAAAAQPTTTVRSHVHQVLILILLPQDVWYPCTASRQSSSQSCLTTSTCTYSLGSALRSSTSGSLFASTWQRVGHRPLNCAPEEQCPQSVRL